MWGRDFLSKRASYRKQQVLFKEEELLSWGRVNSSQQEGQFKMQNLVAPLVHSSQRPPKVYQQTSLSHSAMCWPEVGGQAGRTTKPM